MKKIITTFSLSILLSSILLSQEIENKKASAEIGWRFGDFKDINSTSKPKTNKEILLKILDVQKEQLKTQKDILAVLKKRFDPEPETIIVDGKPCIANSSAKCYKWIPEPEAKRYPIIAKFFSNPTVESANEYMKWYSKHINNAKKAGISLYLAKYQYGDKSANFNIKKEGMLGGMGAGSKERDRTKKKLFEQYSDKFYVNLYLGRGLNVDVFGLGGFKLIVKKNPTLKYNIIYYSDEVKDKLQKISKKYKEVAYVLSHKQNEIVSKKMFELHGVYSTPTAELALRKDNSFQILGTGKIPPSSFVDKTLKYLWYKGIIKDNAYLTDYKFWDNSNYLKEHEYERFKTENTDFSEYDYKNTDMQPREPEKH